MPIRFPPERKSILLCDFDAGGFRPPEMVKRRPVIVLVGRLPHRDQLATVVPLSTTPPHRNCDYQCELILEQPLPPPFDRATTCWAKADMLAVVAYRRLDFFRAGRVEDGRRKYLAPKISEDQFSEVRLSVLRALRFGY